MNEFVATANPEALKLEAHIWALIEKKNFKQAIAQCQEMNRQFPGFASGWRTASQIALNMNRPDVALRSIQKAIDLEPDSIDWQIHKALCLAQLRQTAQLDELVTRILRLKLNSVYHYSTLAMLLTQLERREEAVEFYRRSGELQPGNSQNFYNIAVLQRSLGRIDEAETNLNKAIRLNPKDFEAYKVRSELRTQTPEKNHVRALEKILKRGVEDPRAKAHFCYALAKELEDLEEFDKSFQFLKIGADTRRSYMQYNIETDLNTMDAIRRSYRSELFDGDITGSENDEAIFILGMPRTGTTLCERILASHSDVFAAGELSNFTNMMMQQASGLVENKKISREELVTLTTQLNFAQLGSDYIGSTRPSTGHTLRFIDKLPLNYLYTGLIHLALPNAKIINLRRHPLDTCYAIYKQLFVDGYPFSYQLEELGRYYIAYHRLMAHWNKVMPGKIHTLNYEELVADTEGESRRLLEFCGLDWQEECLKFYESKAASTTASAAQIRKPVYKSSVAKWAHYQEQLEPLVNLLRNEGIDLD
jgi:tetratricopeptide (TPR) repeat protein